MIPYTLFCLTSHCDHVRTWSICIDWMILSFIISLWVLNCTNMCLCIRVTHTHTRSANKHIIYFSSLPTDIMRLSCQYLFQTSDGDPPNHLFCASSQLETHESTFFIFVFLPTRLNASFADLTWPLMSMNAMLTEDHKDRTRLEPGTFRLRWTLLGSVFINKSQQESIKDTYVEQFKTQCQLL